MDVATFSLPDGPTGDQLAAVITLAEHQIELENRVIELQRELEDATHHLKIIQERDLPEAMSSAGIETYTLTGGRKVSIDTKIIASPRKDDQIEMLDWLERNEHGDLIKHEIKTAFGRGEENAVERLLTWIKANLPKHKIDDRRFVHPQTLSAFVREQMREQIELPDAFGVVVLKKSIITRPKQETTL